MKSSKEQAERNSARHHSRERISLYGRLRRRTLCKSRDQIDPSSDIRELLFYQLAEKNLPILAMQLVRLSLEDIFLELTADDQAAKKVITGTPSSPTENADDTDTDTTESDTEKGDNENAVHM